MKRTLIPLVWTLALIPLWGQETEIKPVMGGGFSIRLDDYEDFEVRKIEKKEYLLVKNNSHIRPVIMTGVAVPLKGSWYVVISLGLSEGGRPIDEIFLGAGAKVGEYAIFTGGYSARFGKELSPGFKKKTENVCCGTLSEKYDGYKIRKSGFKGDPIIDSVNKSITFGVMVPVRFWPGEKER